MTTKQFLWMIIIVAVFNTSYWTYQFCHPKGRYAEFVDCGNGDRLLVWKYGRLK